MSQFTFTDALIFAARMHRGQKDRGGVDYIKHPLYLYHKIARRGGSNEAQMVAIMHDAIEDADYEKYGSPEKLYAELNEKGCPESVIEALKLLTHIPNKVSIEESLKRIMDNRGSQIQLPEDIEAAKDEEYFSYVVKLSRNDMARMVKIEDLRHNGDIRRLKPNDINGKTASRIVKYGKALQLLTGGKFGYV